MTETSRADPARAGELAQQIVAILVSEDSDTRRRAVQAAMMLLGETLPVPSVSKRQSGLSDTSGDGHADLARFFSRDEKLKPSDYAQLCAAYHYSVYGPVAFSLDELRAIAADAGVVLPDRLDMTLRGRSVINSNTTIPAHVA